MKVDYSIKREFVDSIIINLFAIKLLEYELRR